MTENGKTQVAPRLNPRSGGRCERPAVPGGAIALHDHSQAGGSKRLGTNQTTKALPLDIGATERLSLQATQRFAVIRWGRKPSKTQLADRTTAPLESI